VLDKSYSSYFIGVGTDLLLRVVCWGVCLWKILLQSLESPDSGLWQLEYLPCSWNEHEQF
jgi:hypothetical protein